MSDLMYPPTIIFGSEMPDLRLLSRHGSQTYFCRRNQNLHLTDEDFVNGTYEAGRFLAPLCKEFCEPDRVASAPCPAFVDSYKVWKDDQSLATVEPLIQPDLTRCGGVQKVLGLTETDEERYFLSAYLGLRVLDENSWRTKVLSDWNERGRNVECDFLDGTRREKFDAAMWRTIRFPALIPQIWMNWLYATSEEHQRALEDNPSRVDFAAFHAGARHIVEIDGPSHYASYDETTHRHSVDERAYARNLKIERSLRSDGWTLTRIGRIEVRDTMPEHDADQHEAGGFWTLWSMLNILPFPRRHDYPPRLSHRDLGLAELEVEETVFSYADDDIPF